MLQAFFGLPWPSSFALLAGICLGGLISHRPTREYALIFYGGRYQALVSTPTRHPQFQRRFLSCKSPQPPPPGKRLSVCRFFCCRQEPHQPALNWNSFLLWELRGCGFEMVI